MTSNAIKVRVPASTANLGPGFDCLGLALSLHNTVELELTDGGLRIDVSGEGADALPRDEASLVYRAARSLLDRAGLETSGLWFRLTNAVPLERGLGSSAAAVVGGLLAANALLAEPLSRDQLLRLAVDIEGHPDNVAPALLGGLVVVAPGDGDVVYARVNLPPLWVALAVPEVRLPTAQARQALPRRVPLSDAVYNLGRVPLVVLALQRGDYDLLRRAMHDRLHQPYRAKLIPGYDTVVSAARRAGAAGVAISGAGPSVVAFAPSGHDAIAEAMAEAFAEVGVNARPLVLAVDRNGASVVEDDHANA